MKYMITALLLASSSMAVAGLSSVDPTVAQARQRFAAAHAPSESEMNLGQTWTCAKYDATAGVYSPAFPKYTITFEKFDGVYVTKDTAQDDTYVPTAQGIVSTTGIDGRPDLVTYLTFRADREGHLLGEDVVKYVRANSWFDDKVHNTFEHSISVNYGYAMKYYVCTSTPKKKKRFWQR